MVGNFIGSTFGTMVAAAAAWMMLTPAEPEIRITDAVAVRDAGGNLIVTVSIENAGSPDRLTGAHSVAAARTTLIDSDLNGFGVPVPVGDVAMAPEGGHLRLSGFNKVPPPGRSVPVTLSFNAAGDHTVKARVVEGEPGPELVEYQGTPPQLSLTAEKATAGWRLKIDAPGFTFDREEGPHEPGHGHAVLYLGGLKIADVHGNEARLGVLPRGEHIVRAGLRTRDGRLYALAGQPITAVTVLKAD